MNSARFRRPSTNSITVLTIALLVTWIPCLAQTDIRQAYYGRLKEISPRDAEAHFQLASWCEQSGLAVEARSLLERIIKYIDPDHAGARRALGYRRSGLEWKIGSERSRGPDGSLPPAGETTTPPASGDSPGTTTGDDKEPPTSGATTDTGTVPKPNAGKAVDRVALKREFARQAAEKLKMRLNTMEDADFMVHTTWERASPTYRQLSTALKTLKKQIQTVIGAKSKAKIWPDKIQIFLFRATMECVRFAEIVDGQRFPEAEGWYTLEDHTVIFKVNSEHLARILAETALDLYNGSDRWVNWWPRIGLQELIASRTEEGLKNRISDQAYELVGSQLEGNIDAINVMDILDRPGMDEREMELSTAHAFTLVDFLHRTSKTRLQKVFQDLKSDKAPASTPEDLEDETAFRKFFIDYIAYQDEALVKAFRMKLEELDLKWKKHIMERARALKPQNPRGGQGGNTNPRNPRGRTGRTTGGRTGNNNPRQ